MWRRAAVLLTLACGTIAAPPVSALDGRVADEEGAPVADGRVCYVVGTSEQVCSSLDDEGRFRLPDSGLERMRIVADGFLPRIVSAVHQDGPWILRRSATLLVRIQDAGTGDPVGEAEVRVVYASGRQRGPFPANRAGVRVRTLIPGPIRVFASADGYAESAPVEATLASGEELELTLELSPAGTEAPESPVGEEDVPGEDGAGGFVVRQASGRPGALASGHARPRR